MKRRVLAFFCFLGCLFFAPFCFSAPSTQIPEEAAAIKAAAAKNYLSAFSLAEKVSNPVLDKLIEWLWLTDPHQDIDFRQAERFMEKNPDWPRIYMIRRNAETVLLDNGTKKEMEEWFRRHPPVSPQAVLTYADLLMAQKEWEKAVPMLHNLWRHGNLSEEDAETVKEKLSLFLDERDYGIRTQKLMDERKVSQARKLFPFLSGEMLRMMQIRDNLISNSEDGPKGIKELSKIQQKNEGLLLDELRWMRLNKKYSAAAKFLEKTPPEKQKSPRWWAEKSALIRQFMTDSDYQTAYTIAKNHHLTSGAEFADAEWTAGWIALRNLKKKKTALEHFERMLQNVSSPLSLARGEYWLGRTYEEMSEPAKAAVFYKRAAEKQTSVYGQLAAGKIKEKHAFFLPLIQESAPTFEQLAAIENSELFKVALLLENAGAHELAELFATRLFLNLSSPEEMKTLAYAFAYDLKRADLTVTVARRARQNGTEIIFPAYPVQNLKHDERTETALILAIIRQESSFSPYAVSSAGARGLMQIMPATAKQIAQKKRKPFSVQQLNTDPDFNVELGSAYFADLLKRFNGSYVLAIAAYNAGPTNVNKWLKSIGNPLEDIDQIDWMERIPFGETRNYVQRVLENLHIYRRYLNYPETKLFGWMQEKN